MRMNFVYNNLYFKYTKNLIPVFKFRFSAVLRAKLHRLLNYLRFLILPFQMQTPVVFLLLLQPVRCVPCTGFSLLCVTAAAIMAA